MMNNRFLLLMTACIAPTQVNAGDNCKLSRVNVDLRLSDYLLAFKYWLEYEDNRITGILFVENSGYDLTLFRNAAKNNPHGRKIEFIQYATGTIPIGLHYGYAELDMIDKVFGDSSILKSFDYVVKVTGRLFFPKLRALLDIVRASDEIVIDSRDYSIFSEQHYCVTTLFVVKYDFYMKYLFNAKRNLTLGQPYIEHLFFNILKPLLTEEQGIVMRFPIDVPPRGFGAHSNRNYSSFRYRLKNYIRSISRYLFPNIWI